VPTLTLRPILAPAGDSESDDAASDAAASDAEGDSGDGDTLGPLPSSRRCFRTNTDLPSALQAGLDQLLEECRKFSLNEHVGRRTGSQVSKIDHLQIPPPVFFF
jgi:hypothetical protein